MATATETSYDAIVVGARCAGSTVAMLMARAGRRVVLVDRDEFPSDTVSTHQLFPDSMALLDELGVGDRLRSAHHLRPAKYSWRVLGHGVGGGFTPVGGHDATYSIRRVSLDAAVVDTAVAAGVETRFGSAVTSLVGSGTGEDPLRGVVLDSGEHLLAPWVVGADGRTSLVARRLGLPRTQERRGEVSMLFAYWEGLPDSGWCHIDVQSRLSLMSSPAEDGIHLLSVAGPPGLTRGSAEQREAAYLAALQAFPTTFDPHLLDGARRVSPLVVVPETMLRGFVRPATGPGWVLVGDAGLFKHPVTAQGIGDALAQAAYVGTALGRGDDLRDYARWRDERAAGHYEWSYELARFPSPDGAAVWAGLAADADAGQELLDTFTRRHRPDAVLTRARRARWRAAWAYEKGLDELLTLLGGLDDDVVRLNVPACPAWTVGDLLAHLVGVAEDTVRGDYFAGAMSAWRDPTEAAERDAWTDGHLHRFADRGREALLRALRRHGRQVVQALRGGEEPLGSAPAWMVAAPAADLAVHLADLREALGLPADVDGTVIRFGLGSYRGWLHQRLVTLGAPALRLSDGEAEWVVGNGSPVGSVTAPPYELFRTVTGRRSAAAIRALEWTTDPSPWLDVISPYPLPQ
jgi:uncharacterized protein (TIGR03083 family)